ncbi:MAG: retropepsin-like aspartic protease [Polyangiaceae bacterium]
MRITKLLFFSLITLVGCGGAHRPASSVVKVVAPISVPFDYVGPSWIRVPADIGGVASHLIFDTGGGITIVSKTLCKQMKCVPDGTASGKRMSGQTIEVKMSRVPSITIAGHRVVNARVAVLDTSDLLHPDLGVDGVAGLDLFRDQAVTIDYAQQRFVIENAASLAERHRAGTTTKMHIENDGPSTVVYLPLLLAPQAPPLEMEEGARPETK